MLRKCDKCNKARVLRRKISSQHAGTEGGGSPRPTRAPPPATPAADGEGVKSAELRAFVRDTPAIRAASVTVATVALMRNLRILLSASAQIAPLGVVISWLNGRRTK